MTTPFVSVIVPAYNQEKTITKDLKSIYSSLKQIRYPFELVVIVNSPDDRTFQKTKAFAKKFARVKTFLLPTPGKGQAVRFGMSKAKGDYIAFIDAGMEIDPNGISMLMEHLEWYQADIIVGSKRHLASQVDYPLIRRFLSFGYYRLVKFLFGFKVSDTQAGIKIFRRQVLKKVLPYLTVNHYAFDIEMLAIAYRLGFRRIFDAPIKLSYSFAGITNAATLKAIFQMLVDTLKVFYRLKLLPSTPGVAKAKHLKLIKS